MVLCSYSLHFDINYYLRLDAVEQNLTNYNRIVINPEKHMNKHQPLRACISSSDKELLIYGADMFSQFPRRDASVS